jgi:isopentenyl phosphate kinase
VIFLKIGGSVITDKSEPFKVDWTGMSVAVEGVAEIDSPLVVGHGGGSFGHMVAKEYEGLPQGFFKIREAMSKLNQLVVSSLLSKDVPAVGFPPSCFMLCKGGDVKEAFWKPVLEATKNHVPVLHGDAILDLEDGYTILSTEQIFGELAGQVKPRRVLLASSSAVMLDGEPLKEINDSNFGDVFSQLEGAEETDVTGGMKSKVFEAAKMSAEHGVEVYVFDGKAPGAIKRASLSGEGTRVRVSELPDA